MNKILSETIPTGDLAFILLVVGVFGFCIAAFTTIRSLDKGHERKPHKTKKA